MNKQTHDIERAISEASRLLIEHDFSQDDGLRLLRAQMIIDAMTINGGNSCKAVRTLRVHRNTLSRLILEQGLTERVARIRAAHKSEKNQIAS